MSRDLPGPAPRGSLLFALANAVGTDALHLVFDLTGLRGSTAADLAAYESDVTALRRYCKTGS